MNIHVTNMRAHLSTLTLEALRKELTRVEGMYTPAQTRYMTEDSLKSWDKHLELIDAEIARKERIQ